jgi:molybdopterin-synthase adenylyltransferase
LPDVLVIGLGGLGCPALLALGAWAEERQVRLTLVDPDRVDLSNLQRQILYRTNDVGRLKVEVAEQVLQRRWPKLQVEALPVRLEAQNARTLLGEKDVVLDGTDDFDSKFLLNDMALSLGVPLVHGGVVGWTGQLMTVVPDRACYRCIFEAPPERAAALSCQEAGILGAVAGVIGGRMAEEARAVLLGEPTLAGTLLVFDALSENWRKLSPKLRRFCPAHRTPERAAS